MFFSGNVFLRLKPWVCVCVFVGVRVCVCVCVCVRKRPIFPSERQTPQTSINSGKLDGEQEKAIQSQVEIMVDQNLAAKTSADRRMCAKKPKKMFFVKTQQKRTNKQT